MTNDEHHQTLTPSHFSNPNTSSPSPSSPSHVNSQMHLNRLCLVLPTEDGEAAPPHHRCSPPTNTKAKPTPVRSCSDQLLAFLHQLLRRFRGRWRTRFCRYHPPEKNQYAGGFADAAGIELLDKVGSDNPRIFSYAELYIGTNGFSEDEVLGSGGFGRVYRAVLPSDGTVVAVKCVSEKGERFEKTFAAELVAVAQLRHRNLVRLKGWCVHEDQLLLVYDYMPNRSLDRILFRKPDGAGSAPLSWERRWRIVNGLAAALFYLHEQLETQIIHRDVKTSNVMLDSHFNARLGDFGLARWLEHELVYPPQMPPPSLSSRRFRLADTTRIGGTIGYLPPESFQKRGLATAKSDVFSFGIVVLEVASGRRAVDLTYPDEQIILLDWVRWLSDEGRHLQAGDAHLPDGSYKLSDMEHLIHLGLLCSLHDPQSRPNMKWVMEALSGNIIGNLPALPLFKTHHLYISLSSQSNSTNTTTNTTTRTSRTTSTSNSTIYITAASETMFETADNSVNSGSSYDTKGYHQVDFLSVDTPREISYKEIVAATDNFSEANRMAEVDFGTAYKGFLDNRHVFVKRLGMKTCPALRARFSDELQNLGRLRHRNLVQLRGWCTEQGEMLVVYDYWVCSMLSHLLFYHDHEYGKPVLNWHQRYNIIRSLATAILYLHEEWEEQVIHRNITSSAVILDPDMNPRLGSFALAEFLTRNEHGHHSVANKKRAIRGIFGYMAPEYLESGEITPMADIYSFGVVVLEVVTGRMAVDFRWPEVLLVKKVREFEAQKRPLVELVDCRLDEDYNHKELVRLVNLGAACTRSDPDLRPSMRQIIRILDGNDKCFKEESLKKERREEWERRNACSLSLIKRIQALGIQ